MRFFGISSLLIVIAIGAWWFSQSSQTLIPSLGSGTETKDGVGNILDSAEKAADQLGNVAPSKPRITVYDGISTLEDATVLDLSGRGLTGSLKAEVRLLTNLKGIDLSNNKFTALPAEVGQLSQLEVLDISNNPITGLPYEIGNLQKLKLLNLKGTNYAKQDLEVIKSKLPETTQILVD